MTDPQFLGDAIIHFCELDPETVVRLPFTLTRDGTHIIHSARHDCGFIFWRATRLHGH